MASTIQLVATLGGELTGGGGGGGSKPQQPTPVTHSVDYFLSCGGSWANLALTGAGDLAFLTGAGTAIRFGSMALREGAIAAMFVRGAARAEAPSALARAYGATAGAVGGVATAERYGIGMIQPDNVAQSSMDGPPAWRSFIPVLATIDAYRAARSCK